MVTSLLKQNKDMLREILKFVQHLCCELSPHWDICSGGSTGLTPAGISPPPARQLTPCVVSPHTTFHCGPMQGVSRIEKIKINWKSEVNSLNVTVGTLLLSQQKLGTWWLQFIMKIRVTIIKPPQLSRCALSPTYIKASVISNVL